MKNQKNRAVAVLNTLYAPDEAQQEYDAITASLETTGSPQDYRQLFTGRLRVTLGVGMGLAMLSQFTGINAVIYYGPRIMEG